MEIALFIKLKMTFLDKITQIVNFKDVMNYVSRILFNGFPVKNSRRFD